ncbi:uncharacterized protein LOC116246040 [Nymphaea colorata]|nr:uncharacterized protein LOC116246040 [Nymphaea colorata]
MARSSSNKYAAINFNEIYGNKSSLASASPSANGSHPPLASARPRFQPNGGMLVLTRPSKPKPQPSTVSDFHHQPSHQAPATVSPQIPPEQPRDQPTHDPVPAIQPASKPDRFVPPHLRPGFTGEGCKASEGGQGHFREGVRPKSGGSVESRGRAEFDGAERPRPGSGGNRMNSNGFYPSSPFYDHRAKKNQHNPQNIVG